MILTIILMILNSIVLVYCVSLLISNICQYHQRRASYTRWHKHIFMRYWGWLLISSILACAGIIWTLVNFHTLLIHFLIGMYI